MKCQNIFKRAEESTLQWGENTVISYSTPGHKKRFLSKRIKKKNPRTFRSSCNLFSRQPTSHLIPVTCRNHPVNAGCRIRHSGDSKSLRKAPGPWMKIWAGLSFITFPSDMSMFYWSVSFLRCSDSTRHGRTLESISTSCTRGQAGLKAQLCDFSTLK